MSNLHTILALDLGTTTGWALRNHDNRITSGTVNLRQQRFEGGGMRFLRFKQLLDEILSLTGKPDAVYFEEVRYHLGTDAAHVYGGFLGQLGSWCEYHKIPYLGVPVKVIKYFISGKGNASKIEVIAAVEALGHKPRDDNEADALALLHFAINRHSKQLEQQNLNQQNQVH